MLKSSASSACREGQATNKKNKMITKNYELKGTAGQIDFVRDLITVENPMNDFEPCKLMAEKMTEKESTAYVVEQIALSATRARDKSIDRSEFLSAAINTLAGLSLDEIARTLHREILEFHNCECGAVLDNRESQYADALGRLALETLSQK